jgi:hypothetical protein
MANQPDYVLSSSSPNLSSDRRPNQIDSKCPSCGNASRFTLIGEQRWPESVAASAGIPAVIRLYVCGHCNSTISEQNLKKS